MSARLLAASFIGVVLTLSCGEQVRVCGVDKACPPHTRCVDGLCQNLPWWSDVGNDSDATCSAVQGGQAPAPRSSLTGGWIGGGFEVFGGDGASGGLCPQPGVSIATAHRWTTCAGWRPHAGAVPKERADAASTTGLGAVWMFGGRTRAQSGGVWTLHGDLWRLDGSPARWSPTITTDLPARHSAATAVQVNPPSVWIHGGDASPNDGPPIYLPDIRRFRLDQSQWEVPPVSGAYPSARAQHGMVALQQGGQLLLFGGVDKTGLRGDTWSFDTKAMTWAKVDTPGPGPRRGAMLTSQDDTVWLFGGIDASEQRVRNDLWRFKSGQGWERVRAGDLGAQATVGGAVTSATDLCVPPSKWVIVDPDSPPRRSLGLLSYGQQRLWLFGGRGACGPLADLWSLDPDTLTWEALTPSSEGYPCERRGSACASWCPE